jgi:plasmid stabilization system protein ParE
MNANTLNDLAGLISHEAEDDADAASRFGNALLDHVDLLSRFPRMGEAAIKRSHVREREAMPVAPSAIRAGTEGPLPRAARLPAVF